MSPRARLIEARRNVEAMLHTAPPPWTVETVPMYARRRWYALHWNGEEPLSYLHDGRTSGRYKNRRDAQERADELNRAIARKAP